MGMTQRSGEMMFTFEDEDYCGGRHSLYERYKSRIECKAEKVFKTMEKEVEGKGLKFSITEGRKGKKEKGDHFN